MATAQTGDITVTLCKYKCNSDVSPATTLAQRSCNHWWKMAIALCNRNYNLGGPLLHASLGNMATMQLDYVAIAFCNYTCKSRDISHNGDPTGYNKVR